MTLIAYGLNCNKSLEDYTLMYTALNFFILAAEVTIIPFLLLFQPNHCYLFQTHRLSQITPILPFSKMNVCRNVMP